VLQKIRTYVIDTYEELVERVTWPTWKELQNNTIIVVVSIVLFSLVVFAMDFTFGITGSKDDFWRGLLGFIY
jgi:preprotein translocase subunit SecE